jgi:hypothetical protein
MRQAGRAACQLEQVSLRTPLNCFDCGAVVQWQFDVLVRLIVAPVASALGQSAVQHHRLDPAPWHGLDLAVAYLLTRALLAQSCVLIWGHATSLGDGFGCGTPAMMGVRTSEIVHQVMNSMLIV